jgi:hypothetical protein
MRRIAAAPIEKPRMNPETNNNSCCGTRTAYAAAILGAFLIVALLVRLTRDYTAAPPLNANRAEERAKALAEIRNVEEDVLHTTAWLDQPKGVVRLRVDDAIKLAEREWQNPAAARSNLIARVDKANPPPAPPPPPKPSVFE